MKINGLYIFISTAIVFCFISASESADVQFRRRNKDGSCTDSNDCYQYEKCENKKCIDACQDVVCGANAWCSLKDHTAVCNCWDNHVGDPYTGCEKQNCTANNDCYEFEKCDNNSCINACESVTCGENAMCKTRYHDSTCVCLYGFVGDPVTGCAKRSCTAGNDCYFFEKCENNECVDACDGSSCGGNAMCEVKDHSAVCTCAEKHIGDPHTECVRQNCTAHSDCYEFEKCESNKCIPACESVSCGENAWCNMRDHVANCSCNWGMVGDPHVKCDDKKCTTDSDCGNSEYCDNNQCTQACDRILCGVNAYCDIKDHAAICTCMDNYTGDPQTECVRQSCTAHTDCYDFEKCEDNKCIAACDSSACGDNAWCDVKDHIGHCTCKPGLIGDPSTECVEKICTTAADCSDSERCENKKCIDTCEDVYCGFNLLCKSQDHIPVCSCADKYTGDVHTGCVRENCTVNADCYDYESCDGNKCVSSCENVKCGENAWCDVKDHVGVCTCINGLTGDPLTKCEGELNIHQPVPVAINSMAPLRGKH